jgi:hypothetical protein
MLSHRASEGQEEAGESTYLTRGEDVVPMAPRHSKTEACRLRSAPGRTYSACRGSSPRAKPPRPHHKRPWPRNCHSTGASSTRRRRTESREMNEGEEDESPRSEERAQGDGLIAPHGGSGNRRSSPESSSDGDAQSPESTRGLGLGLDAGREREGAQLTGPGWFDLTHSGWSDQWAQAVSHFFFYKITKRPYEKS